MKIYILCFEESPNEVVVDRIKRRFEYMFVFDNVYIIKSELNAKELFEYFTKFEVLGVQKLFISLLDDDYFGMHQKILWDFLKTEN